MIQIFFWIFEEHWPHLRLRRVLQAISIIAKNSRRSLFHLVEMEHYFISGPFLKNKIQFTGTIPYAYSPIALKELNLRLYQPILDKSLIFKYFIQYCFICHPSDSTVSENALFEPRTFATFSLAVRGFNNPARSNQT
jgi:hypothetical protein